MIFQLAVVVFSFAAASRAEVNSGNYLLAIGSQVSNSSFPTFLWSASCKYDVSAQSTYTCDLTSTITSYTSTLLVTGSHLNGKYDQDVIAIDGIDGVKMKLLHPTIFAKFYNLEYAYFSNNWIAEILPGIVKGVKLRQLYLYSNDIKEISASTFRDAPNLEGLHLDINMISKIDIDAFLGLSKVKRLNLGRNLLTEIYAKTFDPLIAIEELVLKNNQLENIYSNTFRNLFNLRVLELHNNKLTFVFPLAFDSLPNLRQLTLDGNKLNEIPSEAFVNLKNLEFLNLSNNFIRRLEVSTFKSLTNLRKFYASTNLINTIEKGLIETMLQLVELKLTTNECINQDFLNIKNVYADVAPALEKCAGRYQCTTSCTFA